MANSNAEGPPCRVALDRRGGVIDYESRGGNCGCGSCRS